MKCIKKYFLSLIVYLLVFAAKALSQEVPVLCYHQVREWRMTDSKFARTYIVPPDRFATHMRMLHDSGYHVILPGQLEDHLAKGSSLPSKPILITFDDGTDLQYLNALPALQKYGFPAIFFIMTVTLDRPGYMTRKQVRDISDKGFIIGCHTWDHHKVTTYKEIDVERQLVKPKAELERICAKPVRYFAYPFGVWDMKTVADLKRCQYSAAFQLTGKTDPEGSLYTIRRMIVDGNWNAKQLDAAIKRTFK